MRFCFLYNAIVTFVFCHNVGMGSSVKLSKFKGLAKETSTICTNYHIEWEMSTPSVISCVTTCSTHLRCLGTVYKEDEKVCYGLQSGNEAEPCATKTAGGDIYWKLPDTCPAGWASISDWCYMLLLDLYVWQDASDLCKSYSKMSHLAYVQTNEEYAAIKSWFQSIRNKDTTWIGGYRIDNTENWTWEDGVAVTDDLPWGSEEPDNLHPTDCLRFYGLHVHFGDRNCMDVYAGLCELDIYN